MLHRPLRLFALAALLALEPAAALAQHPGDIWVGLDRGQIVTGGVNADETIVAPVTVFSAELGDSGFPGFTSNPGFDALPGTFPVGSEIGFDVGAAVLSWNGASFEPTGGEAFTISFLSEEITTADGPVAGFSIPVQPNGGWHRHLSWFLHAAPGTALPDVGIYLVELELWSTSPAIESSAPFWIVFDHEEAAEVHQAAIAWVLENLAAPPCPWDASADGDVGFADLTSLLVGWGSCEPRPATCADFTGDGDVGFADLAELLIHWGACP